jgi:hypothetical protein
MGVVKSFPRVKHGPAPQHQGMEVEIHGQAIEVHGHAINAHKIELPQQIK